jgi:hypothetical protein
MSPLLGHRPFLWVTYKENEPYPTTRAQCGLVGTNDCKCNQDQRLNVPSEGWRSLKQYIFDHLYNDWPTLLNFSDRTPKRTDRGAIEIPLGFAGSIPA